MVPGLGTLLVDILVKMGPCVHGQKEKKVAGRRPVFLMILF